MSDVVKNYTSIERRKGSICLGAAISAAARRCSCLIEDIFPTMSISKFDHSVENLDNVGILWENKGYWITTNPRRAMLSEPEGVSSAAPLQHFRFLKRRRVY